MAQHSGFFNAFQSNGVYDRKYNANDYCDNLAVVISNGVLRSTNDDLKVSASGMAASVGVGRAWINGHYYYNDTVFTFPAVSAPISGQRWDRIFLRMDKGMSERSVKLVYQQGTASSTPVKPPPTRTDTVWDLVLADIFIDTNATSPIITDTRSNSTLCGWVFSTAGDNSFFTSLDNAFYEWFDNTRNTLSSVTLFKRYTWRTELSSVANSVAFDVPQWDYETCILEAYVNGVLEHEGVDYTLDGANAVLTFANALTAGTEVIVKVYKSVDGTGIESVADEITELQNKLALLTKDNEYIYMCNGIDDNVQLSAIADEWLYSNTNYDSKIIRVYGTFGCTAPYSGAGTALSPYKWISVGGSDSTNRRIIFDFSGCGQMSLPITAGTYNHIFYGADAHIIGANVIASQVASGTVIRVFSDNARAVKAENCRFWITAYKDSLIAVSGDFVNCRGSIANVVNNSYCFMPVSSGLVKITGGEYYAYTGSSSYQSAVVGQSGADSVSILYGVSAPTLARSGFYQTNSLLQWVGGGVLSCTDLISELPMIVVSGISNIRGTIAKSKTKIV